MALTRSHATNASYSGSPVTFTATATAASAQTIAASSGNNQSGIVGSTLSSPLVILVTDQNSNPVANDTVTVALTYVPANTSITNPLSATSIITNSNGLASVNLTLGKHAGSYTVTATSAGLTGSPLSFTATATRTAANILRVIK